MRLVDLDDVNTAGDEEPGQAGRIRAGRLDPDLVNDAEASEPVQRVLVAASRRRELSTAQAPPRRVESGDVVGLGVRVDPSDDDRAGQLLMFSRHVPLRRRRPRKVKRTQQ